jgi:hypothetical protein
MRALAILENPFHVQIPTVGQFLKSLKQKSRSDDLPFIALQIKEYLRERRAKVETRYQPNSYNEAVSRMKRFWSLYELVNRIFDPSDPVYSIINSGVALSTTADTLTVQAASAGQGRVLEIIIGGEATASAVNRVYFQRAGTSITGNTAITPEKFNTRSPAAAGTYGKGGTQALSGNPAEIFAFNAFGGFIDWKPAPGEEIYYVNSEVVSLRSNSGTSTVSATIVFEEL